MDPTRFNIYKSALELKQATQPCCRCGNTNFTIVDESLLSIHQPGQYVIGGPAIPVVMVGCTKCGWLSLHAKNILTPGAPQ